MASPATGSRNALPSLGNIVHSVFGFARPRADFRAGEKGCLKHEHRVSLRNACMRRKVLVVDDDPYLTTQLRKLLESDEMSVDTFSSGQEALAALGAADYSVLITDLRMPGMGGMELIR